MHILPQAARLLALRPRPVALWGMTVSVPRRYFSQPRVLYQESVLAANDQKPSTSGAESVPANDQSTEAKSVDESTPSKKKKKSKFYLSKSGQWRKKNRSRKSQKDLPPPEDRKSLVELLNPFMTQATQLRAELRKIAQEKNIEISLTDVEKFNQEIKDTNKKFTNFVEAANLSEAFAKEIGRIINRTAREALATTKDEFKKLVNQTRVIENRLKNEEGRYSQLRGMIESNAWKAVKDKQKVIVQFTLLPLHKAALLKKVAKAILANDSPLSTADSASIPTLLSNNRDKYAEVGLSNAEEMDWISKEWQSTVKGNDTTEHLCSADSTALFFEHLDPTEKPVYHQLFKHFFGKDIEDWEISINVPDKKSSRPVKSTQPDQQEESSQQDQSAQPEQASQAEIKEVV